MQKSFKYYSLLIGSAILLSVGLHAQVKTLDEYVHAAIANSPELKEVFSKIEQNTIDSALTSTTYNPQINFNGQALAAPTYGQFGYDNAITNGGTYSAVVSATQIITPRKEIKLNHTISSYEHQSLSVQVKQAEYELRKNVTDKYLNICLLQKQAEFYAKSDTFLISETNTLKTLTDKGIYRMSDYYALLVEEQSERVQVAQLKVQLSQSIGELNQACGLNDTTNYVFAIPHIDLYKQNDVKQLIGYQKFQYDSLQLASQQALLDAQYYPHLSWYADAGIEASRPDLIYRSFGNSLGLNLNIPIYDGHKKELKHKSLAISEGVRSNYEQFYAKTHSAQSTSLVKQLVDAAKLIEQLKNEEGQVTEWMKINKAQLAVGNISVTDFLIGLKKELEVKNDMAQAIINQQLLQNEFNYWNQ